MSPWRGLLALRYTPPAVTMKMLLPGSLLRRSFLGLDANPNDRRYLEVEVPAGNGVGTAFPREKALRDAVFRAIGFATQDDEHIVACH